MRHQIGLKFSTRDQDNDLYPSSCAVNHQGAWWYGSCKHSNLNGLYLRGEVSSNNVVSWHHWKGNLYSLRFTEMKMKPFYE